MKRTTINKEEIDKFSKMAEEWWNPDGKFKKSLKITSKSNVKIKISIFGNFS